MTKFLSYLLVCVFAISSLGATAVPRLFAVNPFVNTGADAASFGFYEINPATAATVASLVITVPGRTITSANALALDPTTGIAYAVVKATGVTGRLLVTINLDTAVGVEIGDLGANFSSLAFRADGQLFGTTGDGATPPETLFTINKANAAKVLEATLGNGADGEIIAYNPVDTNLYHFSGNGTAVLEKFPSTAPYTPITNISGATGTSEVFGAVWNPAANVFLISNISAKLLTISSTGVVGAEIGVLPNDLRGLILLLDQVITGFAPTSPVVFGAAPAALTATGGASGSPIVYATTSPTVCTVTGSTVTFVGVGACNLTANQAAGGVYAAAPQVTATITVNPAPQVITGFTPASPVVFGAPPATLTATGGASGNPVVFATTSLAAICTVSGSAVTFVGVGVCNLTADQAGGGNYSAAPQVTAAITINPAPSSIVGFSLPISGSVGGSPITLSATGAPSGAPIVFSTTSAANVCTVVGNVLTLVGPGVCVVTANQAAAGNYTAAAPVSVSISITPPVSVPALDASLLLALVAMLLGLGFWSRRRV